MNLLHELAALVHGGQSNPTMGGAGQMIPGAGIGAAIDGMTARPRAMAKRPMPIAPQLQQAMQPQGLQVVQSGGMQPFGGMQEDDYTPGQALQPVNYNNGQVSQHSAFRQGSPLGQHNPMQGTADPLMALRQLLGF